MLLVLFSSGLAWANPLKDVPPNHWAYEELSLLYASGLIVGFPDETFRGNENMTRYQFAEVMGKLLSRLEAIAGRGLEAAKAAQAGVDELREAIKKDFQARGETIDDATAQRLAEAIDKLRTEFRTELDQRVSSLEKRVSNLEEKATALEDKTTALEQSQGVQDLKTAKTLGWLGVILGALGLAAAFLVK